MGLDKFVRRPGHLCVRVRAFSCLCLDGCVRVWVVLYKGLGTCVRGFGRFCAQVWTSFVPIPGQRTDVHGSGQLRAGLGGGEGVSTFPAAAFLEACYGCGMSRVHAGQVLSLPVPARASDAPADLATERTRACTRF